VSHSHSHSHSHWKLTREKQMREGFSEPPEIAAEREQIRLAHELGQLVYDRRKSLGLTEAELGRRLGVPAEEVDALELGGVLSATSELLAALAVALEVAVDLRAGPTGHNTVTFTLPHAA
jgi:ribosome-binding protein aMBF1 (putative translation factor)